MPVPAGEAEGEAEAGPVPETGPRAEPAPGPTPPPGTARPAAVSGQAAGPAGPLIRQLAERTGVDLAAVHGTGPGGRITRADIERAAPAPGRRRVSPLARRLAEELQVDLADVTGSGSQGAVHADDVRRAAYDRAAGAAPMGGAAPVHPARPGPAPPAPSAGITPVPPPPPARHAADRTSAMRQAIAALMARSKREIPHYYLSTTIDLAAAMDWLRAYNRGRPAGGQLVPAALLLQAAALAARRVPQLNGFWTDDHFTAGEGVQLGVAVSLRGGGLIAPVLHDADTLGAPELMAGLKDLVARARTGRLRGSELTGATITVTNLGDQGVESVLGVIHPPQVALVGFGRVVEQPRAVSGLIGVRPVVTATLSADHRASDGAMGARYLTAVDRLLQKPEELRAPEKLAQPEELEKPEES
jgi:pyruvate dehydrogenase E2 component (dihydrolipoamide acetyltransferase)